MGIRGRRAQGAAFSCLGLKLADIVLDLTLLRYHFDFPPSGAFKNAVETPWVLTAAKLYAQQSGRADSNCAAMIYGRQGAGGITKGYGVERVIQRGPVPTPQL